MTRNTPLRVPIVGNETGQKLSIVQHLRELSTTIEILSAKDKETALAMLECQHIEILIIDAFMKGAMDGFELSRTIRSTEAHRDASIILLLSGHLITEHSRAMSAGADLILHSPPVKEELWSMVVLLLKWSSGRSEVNLVTTYTQVASGESFLKSA